MAVSEIMMSRALADARRQPIISASPSSRLAFPAPITVYLQESEQPLSTENLLNFDFQSALVGIFPLSNKAESSDPLLKVHSTSKDLLRSMMLYHMNQDIRIDILKIPVPSDMQTMPDLGIDLPSPLKSWLKDTYAPAYVSYAISQVKKRDVTWKNNFSQNEDDKLWYWWTGKVLTRLCNSTRYFFVSRC